MFRPLVAVVLIFALAGCDAGERAKLEKENKELKEAAAKNRTAEDYDLQAKCSKDARVWFKENWSRDKDTIVLDFPNHYHKGMNKCFIRVEYHYNFYVGNGSWVNDLIGYDVYENSKFANFSESHSVYPKPEYHTEDRVAECDVWDKKCKAVGEFNNLVQPYMNN